MAAIAGLYGGYTANQEDGSGGRAGFFRGWKGIQKGKGGAGDGRGGDGRGGDGPGGPGDQDFQGQSNQQQNPNFNNDE